MEKKSQYNIYEIADMTFDKVLENNEQLQKDYATSPDAIKRTFVVAFCMGSDFIKDYAGR